MKRLFSSFKSRLGFSHKESDGSEIVDTTVKAEGLASPSGLSVVASAGGGKSERPNFFNDETVEFEETSEPTLLFKDCGHKGSQEFKFNIWGNSHGFKLKDKKITRRNGTATAEGNCPKCYFEQLKISAIRCCMCGYAILPGDGVALYHKSSKHINKTVATFVGDSAAGCLLWACCPSGGFFAGHWGPEGFKSAFEGGTAAEEVLKSGKPVVVNV